MWCHMLPRRCVCVYREAGFIPNHSWRYHVRTALLFAFHNTNGIFSLPNSWHKMINMQLKEVAEQPIVDYVNAKKCYCLFFSNLQLHTNVQGPVLYSFTFTLHRHGTRHVWLLCYSVLLKEDTRQHASNQVWDAMVRCEGTYLHAMYKVWYYCCIFVGWLIVELWAEKDIHCKLC